MAALYEKDVGVGRTAAVSRDVAWALSDEIRRSAVRHLYKRSMTTAEIAEALAQDGFDKAKTTIRHHMEILRKAGIVEVCRIVQVRGMVEKHYTANTRLIGHDAQDGFDEAYAREIDSAARRMGQILARLSPRAARRSGGGGGADPDREESVLFEIVNRAMTRVLDASAEVEGSDEEAARGARRAGRGRGRSADGAPRGGG